MTDTVDERTHDWRNRDRRRRGNERPEDFDGIEAARKLYGPADTTRDDRDEYPTDN